MTGELTLHLGVFEWTVENHLTHIKRRFSNQRFLHIIAEQDGILIGFNGVELKNKHIAYNTIRGTMRKEIK
jgi:hypothetical protein